jgi:hypothetical protein
MIEVRDANPSDAASVAELLAAQLSERGVPHQQTRSAVEWTWRS